MKYLIGFVIILITGYLLFSKSYSQKTTQNGESPQTSWWQVQSIDTMKISRDLAREKLKDISFDQTIDEQVANIAATGATHVAIGTPYDDEFIPFLKRWVVSARAHGLKVWYRGNFSGWEGWFEYPKINRDEHLAKTKKFLEENLDLFIDGDIFTSCPECENGGPGDPRHTGDTDGHRQFLIAEYQLTTLFFNKVAKKIITNYYSMNGDVARKIMDKKTTKALGGIVAIDHYVSTPQLLASDIEEIAKSSGGSVVLSEFGAPIPDLNGHMTADEQLSFLAQTFRALLNAHSLVGLNYWTNVGGSTALWTDSGVANPAVSVVTKFYKPALMIGKVVDEFNQPIGRVSIKSGLTQATTDPTGKFVLPMFENVTTVQFAKPGYINLTMAAKSEKLKTPIILHKTNYTPIETLIISLQSLLSRE